MAKLFVGTPLPARYHMTLQAADLKPRTLIVGDIHGCLQEFQELLTKASYDKNDTSLILVGDLVNKGPFNAGVIKYARSLGAYCVRGNHDHALLYHACAAGPKMDRPESYNYIDELDADDLAWLSDCPFTISLPSLDAIVVHAGLVPGVNLDAQSEQDMMTMRNIKNVEETDNTEAGAKFISCDVQEGVAWASAWNSGPHVYFGHDAKRLLQQYDRATGLDTGCVYGKKLSGVVLPGGALVQVDAHHMYSEPMDRKVPNI